MRVYAFAEAISLEGLRLIERPDPVPGPHDVVLRMRAATLNFRDLAIVRGNYHVGVVPPLVPVSDGAGEVVQVGAAVTRFRLGDLVCPIYLPTWLDGPIDARHALRRLGGPSDGVLAEFLSLHEDEAVLAPDHLDATEAAALPVASVTAWHALYRNGCVRPGETIVIQGGGGVSIAALQLARAGGARPIVVLRNGRHADRLRELGAGVVLTNGADQRWSDSVRDLTDGAGAEVAVNVAGGATLSPSIAATRMGGTVHLIGYVADTGAQLDIFTAIRHAATIRVAAAGNRRDFEELNRAMRQHRICPPIARTFPLARLRDALDALAQGGQFGKIALTVSF
jgi:NADPH:quinone reductase-like Zn-dependent oxidoreductase